MSLYVPLAVRLKTASADRHVTAAVRDLSFGSVVPGGFAQASFALDRPLALQPDEIAEYADVVIYDTRNGEIVWQGQLEDSGRTAGPDGEIWALDAVGPSARAQDRTVPLIYVDRSQERWVRYTEPNTNRSGATEPGEDNNETPYLKAHAPRGTSWAAGDVIGWAYRALKDAGMYLGRVGYTWDAGETDSDWRVQFAVVNSGGTRTQIGNQGFDTGGGSNSGVVTTDWTSTHNIVEVRIARQTSTETVPGDADWAIFANIVITGLRYTAAGVEDTTAANYSDHVHVEEVIADLLGRLLTMYDGASASVATHAFEIEQLAYPDGVTAAQVLEDLIGFHGDHYWAAWEDTTSGKSRFEWRLWPTTVRYEASAIDGFESPGSIADLWNAVRVRWRDVNGRLRTNRRTQTVQALTDAGLTREAFIDLGDDAGTSAAADRAGDQFLAEHGSAPNAGELTVRTPIYDRDLARLVMPWELRPGHLIRVRDVLPSLDALNRTARDGVTVFRVISTRYSAADNTCVLGLDSPARTIEQFVARSQAQAKRASARRR